MKGLEAARLYCDAYGRQLLESAGECADRIAFALTGSGSECLGYDHEVSRDHDFAPGFQVFLPGEELVDERQEFLLERSYARLPAEFMGLKRLGPPVRGRRGVIRAAEFFRDRTGTDDGHLTLEDWCRVPQYALAEAVNGEVFYDPSGFLTRIRQSLIRMPEDALRKRLAGQLTLMDQAGMYNYARCLSHGEELAAQWALTEFCGSAMEAAFLLSGRYMPYYKWASRALGELKGFEGLPQDIAFLMMNDNAEEARRLKLSVIHDIARGILDGCAARGRTNEGELSRAAAEVNEGIRDAYLRTAGMLYAV